MTGTNPVVQVLFVCMGNICRSPAAEGVFREFVRRAGHGDLIHVESAGTLDYHEGSLPDHRMCQAASQRGYNLDSLARQVTPSDLDRFDLIIVMDHVNLRDLTEIIGATNKPIRLLGSFLNGTGQVDKAEGILPVPDPYYGGRSGFEYVLDMIETACPKMLEYCLGIVNARSE